jgi:hypothetical protein
LNLFANAHGRPVDGRDHVGVGEQIATLQLIADFAASEKLLRNAAQAGLQYVATWGPAVEASAGENTASPSQKKIADTAKAALDRLR